MGAIIGGILVGVVLLALEPEIKAFVKKVRNKVKREEKDDGEV
jgi:hypothetical protein